MHTIYTINILFGTSISYYSPLKQTRSNTTGDGGVAKNTGLTNLKCIVLTRHTGGSEFILMLSPNQIGNGCDWAEL